MGNREIAQPGVETGQPLPTLRESEVGSRLFDENVHGATRTDQLGECSQPGAAQACVGLEHHQTGQGKQLVLVEPLPPQPGQRFVVQIRIVRPVDFEPGDADRTEQIGEAHRETVEHSDRGPEAPWVQQLAHPGRTGETGAGVRSNQDHIRFRVTREALAQRLQRAFDALPP